MARDIFIVQIGLGGVGQALAQHIMAQSNALAARDNFVLHYLALVDRSGALFTGEPLPHALIAAALAAKQAGKALTTLENTHPIDNWYTLLPKAPCIAVDVTASDTTAEGLRAAVGSGHCVVLANKRPLTADLALFNDLTDCGSTRYEATVGAGLPVISTLRSLIDSGDTVNRIEACMSGTLGYLCTALQEGIPLSQAVATARKNGWTEPDPRDDLSGADVSRKALILARTCGLQWDMEHVASTAWFSPELANMSIDEFMERVSTLDASYAERVAQAKANNAVLRYVATVTPQGASIALQEVPLNHPLATLHGTDNLLAFTTMRYAEQPLIVRGPGAGTAVTAGGVLSDIVATARELR